ATFSVGYAETAHDERPYARAAARHLGTRHEELVVTPADARAVVERIGVLLDEPIADMSFVPLYLLSRAARAHVTVALTGDGGDELFGGYPAMGAAWWQDLFARLPAWARRALARAPLGPEAFSTFVASLGERAPFLDHKLVELVGRIPPSLRLRGLRELKRLLKDALSDRLPAETLRRGKHGFTVPLAEWFRGPLRATLCDILDHARIAEG